MALDDKRIGIVGGGLIGATWSALFVHHGADVILWDPAPNVRESATRRFEHAGAQLTEIGPGTAGGRFAIADDLESAVVDATLVQENAPEKIDLKRSLYAELEALVDDDTIIASSTSSLRWSDLTPEVRVPERIITAHPFNPPHLVPLVELYGTDADVLDRVEAIYVDAGRVPVRLNKDATGHIANRLSSALWREAVYMVSEGIADVAAIDAALVNGPGLRWSTIGTHLGYHLGGGEGGLAAYLDHLGPSQERRWADLGEPTLDERTKDLLVAGVEAEARGRSIAELEAERDAALIAALRSRRELAAPGSRASGRFDRNRE